MSKQKRKKINKWVKKRDKKQGETVMFMKSNKRPSRNCSFVYMIKCKCGHRDCVEEHLFGYDDHPCGEEEYTCPVCGNYVKRVGRIGYKGYAPTFTLIDTFWYRADADKNGKKNTLLPEFKIIFK